MPDLTIPLNDDELARLGDVPLNRIDEDAENPGDDAVPAQRPPRRPQRSLPLPLRQRQEIQEVLPALSNHTGLLGLTT